MAGVGLLASPAQAHASMFQGETLDAIANGIAWVVLVVAPLVGIAVFWLVHILPEKIAHKRGHPQTGAIQCLCLLSLVFGGLLWPIAWLWAYSKPVLYKLAYGTDVADAHGGHGGEKAGEKVETAASSGTAGELRGHGGEGGNRAKMKGGKA
jgi:CBS domain containing-hemolysin-like protein